MKTKVIIVTLVLGIVAFLANPSRPLGGFWAPPAGGPQPSGTQFPLLILLNIVEALALGLGVSFLIFGYPLVKALTPASKGLTRAAHLSLAWFLISWWPHRSLHVHVGLDYDGLLAIEYGFHVTLILAGLIIAYFYLTLLRQRTLPA